MDTFSLIPILGLKSNIPHDDPTLLKGVAESYALSHHVDGVNVDFARKRGACSKSYGKAVWSNSATADALNCLGMFELWDGSTRSQWMFMGDNSSKGRIFRYDGSKDPERISDVVGHAGATEFGWSDLELYSVIRYGSDMVFTDFGNNEPHFAGHTDTTVATMVNAGTHYLCRYLELFNRRIILAYTDQTNGDIEIRYSDELPTLGSMEIPAGNQVFKPGSDSITGIKNFGSNACFLYSQNSIDRIDYYPNYVAPFAIVNMVSNEGAANHHSIVEAHGAHYFFNRNYYFVEYRGGTEFPYGGVPISRDIEDKLDTVNPSYYPAIVGMWYQRTQEIVWAVPLNSSSSPTHLFFYSPVEKQWRIEDKPMRYLDSWQTYTTMTWNDLIEELGGTGATWADASTSRWADFTSPTRQLVMSNEDGHTYQRSSETDNGSDIDGYRVEPAINLAREERKALLNELWVGLVNRGTYDIDFSLRTGDTLAELRAQSFTSIGSISTNDPANAKLNIPASMSVAARYHQVKWGADAKSEPYSVNRLIFKYVKEGQY